MNIVRPAMVLALLSPMMAWGQSSTQWLPIYQSSGSTINCPSDSERAELAHKAEKGDATAQDALGGIHLSTCPGKNDKAQGIELLQLAAAKGNVHAQVRLGEAYRAGNSVQKNIKTAISWLEKAATTGDAHAQNDLGVIYVGNEGVSKDTGRAVQYFSSAAEQDLPEAQYNLAAMYDQGLGLEQNYELARKWYVKAAQRQNGAAQYRLGMMYEQGLGVSKNQEEAMRWFKLAANHGSEDAQVRLGMKSPSEAHSIESGYFQYIVGQSMLSGKGVQKDEARGVAFLQKSAEAGYPPAMVALAHLFTEGKSVAKDEAKAVDYYQQAIARDPKYALAYNGLAWLYVTTQDAKLHEPQRALENATKAVALSDGNNASMLDTLAHAYFQTGNIDKAVEIESTAAALAPSDSFIQKTLAEYKNAKDHGQK
jgi:TPR repeat protein